MPEHIITRSILFVFLGLTGLNAQITVESSGDVGVGTTAPQAKLEVERPWGSGGPNDVAAFFGSRIADSGRYNTYIIGHTLGVGYDDPTDGAQLWINWNGYQASGSHYRDFVVGNGRRASLMRVVGSSGNVGIGTASPDASLDIWKSYSAGTDSLRFSFNDGSAYWMGIQTYVVGAGNVGYKFRTHNVSNTVDALAITGNGKIGIGTTSPSVKLDVVGDGSSAAVINARSRQANVYLNLIAGSGDDATGELAFERTGATQGNLYFGGNATGNIVFRSGGYAYKMVINSNGNVGIGTSAPTYKLEVAGDVRAASFIANSNTYADFVFDPNYELQSLSDVEAHIEEHGHLPDIPSEAEAMEQGINLADFQVKLLQKIEELTLHQIAQEKRLNAQSERIEQLEIENNILRETQSF